MSRRRKTAHVADKSEVQLSGLRAIDPNLDLGEGCNVVTIQGKIDLLRDKVSAYNDALAVIDSTQIEIEKLEKELKQLDQKAMLGVAFRYGKESHEYRLAGGKSPTEAARKGVVTRLKLNSQEELNLQN